MTLCQGPFILYKLLTFSMFRGMDKLYLTPKIEEISGKIRIELYSNVEKFYGILYYEPVKRGFINKPISLNQWLCVDATIQGEIYVDFPTITPVGLLRWGTYLISQGYGGTQVDSSFHTYERFSHEGDYHNLPFDGYPNTPYGPEWSGTTHDIEP